MKYNYPELQEPCLSCLGCQRLEDLNFTGDKNCRWQSRAEDCIKQIKLNLGVKNVLERK